MSLKLTLTNFTQQFLSPAEPQELLVPFLMTQLESEKDKARLQRYAWLVNASQVKFRRCNGVKVSEGPKFEYRYENADMGTRMDGANETVCQVFENFYREEMRDPENSSAPNGLVHVTCTSYYAPSGAEQVAARCKWDRTTVTNSYHHGCRGFIPGMRIAASQLAAAAAGLTEPQRRVDVVHTELSAMHISIEPTPEQIIVSSLFGDGYVKYSVVAGEDVPGYEVMHYTEMVCESGAGDMQWKPCEKYFKMVLTKHIPRVVFENVKKFVDKLLQGRRVEDLGPVAYAIHPGGPAILDAVRDGLGLKEEELFFSRKVLAEQGNMSSATVPTILGHMLASERVAPGTTVITVAVGPGITFAGVLLKKNANVSFSTINVAAEPAS